VKEILGIIAAILVLVGYVPYIRDTIKGKTQPHVYSWFLWAALTIAILGIQLTHHAGAGSLITITAGTMCVIVFFLSLRGGKRNIVFTDTIVFALAILTNIVWLFAKQPLLAMVLACTADLLAFAPTVRKSWNQPFTETLSFYQLNSLRFALGAVALQQYTVINLMWPAMWAICNGLFALVLIQRRKVIKNTARV
jgi:hypothetical protein